MMQCRLQETNQEVPDWLASMASRYGGYEDSRPRRGGGDRSDGRDFRQDRRGGGGYGSGGDRGCKAPFFPSAIPHYNIMRQLILA